MQPVNLSLDPRSTEKPAAEAEASNLSTEEVQTSVSLKLTGKAAQPAQ